MKLNLHRSGHAPDWELIPRERWNGWQQLAARTNGFVTPGNLLTLLGFGLSMWGVGELIADVTWWALGLLVVGRLLDIADGAAAQATGTKSRIGELLDAVVDKIILVLTVAGMFAVPVAPTWLLGVFVLPHVIIVVITFVDRVRRVELHPSRLGKTTALLAWIAVPLILLVHTLDLGYQSPAGVMVTLFTLVSAAFGFITANSYLTRPQ